MTRDAVDIAAELRALTARVEAAERRHADDTSAMELVVSDLRDRVAAAEKDASRAWYVIDALVEHHACTVCDPADRRRWRGCVFECEACSDTGVAAPAADPSPELVAAGGRVLG